MKTLNKQYYQAFLLMLFAALAAPIFADQNLAGNVTVTGGSTSGNLNVTGALNVTGIIDNVSNSFVFGTQGASFGGGLFYQDNNVDTFTFSTNRNPASWLWQHNAAIPAMRLDASHQLLLYQADGSTTGIALAPASNQLSLGTAILTGGATGTLTAGGAVTVTGTLTAQSSIINNGTLTGGATGLNLNAGGTNQSITLTPNGTGNIILNGNVGIGTSTLQPENRLTLGALSTTEGGQIALLPGSSYSTSWMFDIYAGTFRLLKGSAVGASTGVVFTIDTNNNLNTTGNFNASGQGIFGPSAPPTDAIVNAGTNNGAYGTAFHGAVVSGSGVGAMLDVSNGSNTWGNDILVLRRQMNGGVAPAVGMAGKITFTLDAGSAASHAAQNSGQIASILTATNGVNNSTALAFSTATLGSLTEKLRIDNSGNVGIGTTTPSNMLTITGPANGNPIIAIADTVAAGYTQLRYTGTGRAYQTGVGNAAETNFGVANKYFLYDGNANLMRLVMDSAGNLGIGTTAPWSIAHVVGPASEPTLTYQSKAIQSWNWPSGSELDLTISNNSPYTISFQTRYTLGSGTTYPLALNPLGGNVGIGTTNPTQKLTVNGTIRAKEVIVDTGWSDYVFDDGYRLAPLSEVEQQIKADKHLPGIPSAADVAEHGIKMGDMQSKLLAKIEELTLRQIAQEKQLNAQSARIAQLEHDNEALQRR